MPIDIKILSRVAAMGQPDLAATTATGRQLVNSKESFQHIDYNGNRARSTRA